MIGWFGCAMLCYVTPKEHLGLPDRDDVSGGRYYLPHRGACRRPRQGHPAAQIRDDAVSRARFDFRWQDQFNLGSIPRRQNFSTTRRCPRDAHKTAHFCSMCGPQFCSMKITQDIRDEVLAMEEREKGMAEKSANFWKKAASFMCDRQRLWRLGI